MGKGVARKLRAGGRIPAIFYGKREGAVPIALDPHTLRRLLEKSDAGMNTLINLHIEGGGALEGKTVLIKELQRDPVQGQYLHADFYAVDLEHTIEVSVPIHVTGRAAGVELGGILDHSLRELELECLPRAIPKEIVIDVSALEIGDSLHVRDLELPEGVTLRSDLDLPVLSVVQPSVSEEATPTEEAAEVEGEAPAEGVAPAEGEAGAAKAEGGEDKSGD
jgi:large subunit ribosomal protein L25